MVDQYFVNLRQMLKECNNDPAELAARLRADATNETTELAARLREDATTNETTARGMPKRIPQFAGRFNLHRYIVAIKHSTSPYWPKEKQKDIERAQRLYDAGTHEVFQGHDGPWRILYCKQRRRPVDPRNYFRSMVTTNAGVA